MLCTSSSLAGRRQARSSLAGTGPCWAHGWPCWRWCWLPAASLVRGRAWRGGDGPRRGTRRGGPQGGGGGSGGLRRAGETGRRMPPGRLGTLGLSRGGVWHEGAAPGWCLSASGGLSLPGGRTHQVGFSAQGKNPASIWGYGAGRGGGQVSGGAWGTPGRRWDWGGRGWTKAQQAQTRWGGEGLMRHLAETPGPPGVPHPTGRGAGSRWLSLSQREKQRSVQDTVTPSRARGACGLTVCVAHLGPCAGVAPRGREEGQPGPPCQPAPRPAWVPLDGVSSPCLRARWARPARHGPPRLT